MEIWKDIEGYEGHYQVSNRGKIKSLKFGREKTLKLHETRKGYSGVTLSINSKIRTMLVHRAVAKAFKPSDDNRPQINHKNGDKKDNRVENLEWCTDRENKNHGAKNNLYASCENHYTTTLTGNDIKNIRLMLDKGILQDEIAKMYNVDQSTISNIKTKKTWRHLL